MEQGHRTDRIFVASVQFLFNKNKIGIGTYSVWKKVLEKGQVIPLRMSSKEASSLNLDK